jgi:hypothetical protein
MDVVQEVLAAIEKAVEALKAARLAIEQAITAYFESTPEHQADYAVWSTEVEADLNDRLAAQFATRTGVLMF